MAAACAVAYVQAGNGDSSRTPSGEARGGTPRQPPARTAPVVNATPSRSTPSPTPLWGCPEPAGRRAPGILAPGQAATAGSCREAAGTAPLSSTRMEDAARAGTNGVVEGATLSTVTDQGRSVASKATAIDRPGTAHAPVPGMDVTVWGAKG
ncbi:hypothetical protein [Streptomyces sp. SCL15-4]|uniref:hypothetical protein n=1 Tax=Streptomyces sp. SCL15-4 TaxID=2967221 RepID=UPI0029663263|nr:hypothetical protein [Streptomyces sp. SCL15-4]